LHGHRVEALFNIRVLNLSLGRAIYESYKLDPVCQAVEAAWKSGIVVVVAAGNNGRYQPTDGYGTITSPGNDPYVITVGAMKPMGTPTRVDDLIASYSSKGPTAIDAS
jgi:serine protease AprX